MTQCCAALVTIAEASVLIERDQLLLFLSSYTKYIISINNKKKTKKSKKKKSKKRKPKKHKTVTARL